jgi:glycerate kinase
MAQYVVVAPDKFKGSVSASQAAAAIIRGIVRRDPSIRTVECPVADGGEGTLAAALSAGYDRIPVVAPGPTGVSIDTSYARNGELAVVEIGRRGGSGAIAWRRKPPDDRIESRPRNGGIPRPR